MKQQKPKNKLSKEERERIDNKVVLATAIALVSAMVLLFLGNWLNSVYASQTRVFVKILQWAGVVGVAAMVALYFWKKDKKYLFVIPYFAVGALFMQEISGTATFTKWIYQLYCLIRGIDLGEGVVSVTSQFRFNVLYILLAVYLVASYIYYGLKLKKAVK